MYAIGKGEIEPSFILTNIFNHKGDSYTEFLAPEGQIEKFEQILKKYNEKIIPLY